MIEPGGDLDLALEPLWTQRVRELGVKDLQRDRPIVLEIAREIHGSHAPAPELALNAVAVR